MVDMNIFLIISESLKTKLSASKIVINVVFQIHCYIISEQSLAIDHIEWY